MLADVTLKIESDAFQMMPLLTDILGSCPAIY